MISSYMDKPNNLLDIHEQNRLTSNDVIQPAKYSVPNFKEASRTDKFLHTAKNVMKWGLGGGLVGFCGGTVAAGMLGLYGMLGHGILDRDIKKINWYAFTPLSLLCSAITAIFLLVAITAPFPLGAIIFLSTIAIISVAIGIYLMRHNEDSLDMKRLKSIDEQLDKFEKLLKKQSVELQEFDSYKPKSDASITTAKNQLNKLKNDLKVFADKQKVDSAEAGWTKRILIKIEDCEKILLPPLTKN